MRNLYLIFTKILAVLGVASGALAGEPIFEEGQCWTYDTRPGEEASFLVIRKIETVPKLGEIVHISVFGLKIKNPRAPQGYSKEIGHVPISVASLKASIKSQTKADIPPLDWQDGYGIWLEDKGGAFTIPVKECINAMEEVVNQTGKN